MTHLPPNSDPVEATAPYQHPIYVTNVSPGPMPSVFDTDECRCGATWEHSLWQHYARLIRQKRKTW